MLGITGITKRAVHGQFIAQKKYLLLMLGSKHFPHVPIFIEDFPICSHKKRAHFYGFLWFVPFVPIHFSTVNVTNWLHLMTTFLGAHHPHVPLLMLRVNLPFASRILPYVSMFPIYVAIFSYSFSYVFPYVPHMSTTSFQMNWWQEDEDLDLQPTLFQQWMGDLRGDESAMALIFWGFQCFPQDLPRIVSASAEGYGPNESLDPNGTSTMWGNLFRDVLFYSFLLGDSISRESANPRIWW